MRASINKGGSNLITRCKIDFRSKQGKIAGERNRNRSRSTLGHRRELLQEAWSRCWLRPTAWWMGAAGGAAGFWVPHRSFGRRPPLEAGAAGSNGVVTRRRTVRVAGWGAA